MVFFTPGRMSVFFCPLRSVTREVISTSTVPASGHAWRIACAAAFFSSSRTGQAGVVSSTVTRTSVAVDGDVLDEPEGDDILVEVRIADDPEGLQNAFFGDAHTGN